MLYLCGCGVKLLRGDLNVELEKISPDICDHSCMRNNSNISCNG